MLSSSVLLAVTSGRILVLGQLLLLSWSIGLVALSWLVGGSLLVDWLLVLLHWLLICLWLVSLLGLICLLLHLLGLICLLLTVDVLAVAAIALLVGACGSILLLDITITTSGSVLLTVVLVDRLGLWLHSAVVLVPLNVKPVLFKSRNEVSELAIILMAFNDRVNCVDSFLIESGEVILVCSICTYEFILSHSLRISNSLGAICN